MNLSVIKPAFARRAENPVSKRGIASVLVRARNGRHAAPGARVAPPGHAPLQPPRARGAGICARCQARPDSVPRPESASQRVYSALRDLGPALAQNPCKEVQIQAADLMNVLESYQQAEKTLANEPGMRVVLDVGLQAAAALQALLGMLESMEKKAKQGLPSLRKAKAALSARREELYTLAWRARLDLCMRLDAASKE